MKNRIFTLLVLFIFVGESIYAQFFPVDTTVLNSAYRELIKNPQSTEKQIAFFDAFPSSWDDFRLTYGFFPNTGYDLAMYNIAHDHISALGSILPNLPDTLVTAKIINLSIGGRWEADGPAYLQNIFREYIKQFPENIFDGLDYYSNGKQLRFWQFIFSGRLKNKISKDIVLQSLRVMDSKENKNKLQIMWIGYDFADGEEASDSR